MRTKHEVAAEEARDRELARATKALSRLDKEFVRSAYVEGHPHRLAIKAPQSPEDEFFVVLNRISDDGTPEVAFHSGSSFADALIGVANRLRNGSLKWRKDEYA